MNMKVLPYLSNMFEPVSGVIKTRFEDFVVEEIPAYLPSGDGDHTYFGIEKMGITTARAVRDIARALRVKPRDIGVAGMKDARAVTRQMLSVEHCSPEKIEALDLAKISILWVNKHKNKLKTGHLHGNRFIIKLRETNIDRLDDVRSILEMLEKVGVPNYFGPQRFGSRGDTWEIGRELIRGDFLAASKVIAGNAGEMDTGDVLVARRLFDEGKYEESARAWPNGYGECATLCYAMERWPDNPRKAILNQDRRMLSLYASAFQSYLFNKLLASRITELNKMKTGDLAWKHDKGVVFKVDDGEAETPRAVLGEISPSGPMFGSKMTRAEGDSGLAEQKLLDDEKLTIKDFPKTGPYKCTGGRRSMRFFPDSTKADAGEDELGSYLELAFNLPPGCYATVLLREICKDLLIEG